MIEWLAMRVGAKAAPYVLWAVIALIAGGTIFGVARCTRDHTAEDQAEQTTRSGEAMANAAESAIDKIGNQSANAAIIERSVIEASKGIDDAQAISDIHNAVVSGVCRQAVHRNDPACRVRGTDPKAVR